MKGGSERPRGYLPRAISIQFLFARRTFREWLNINGAGRLALLDEIGCVCIIKFNLAIGRADLSARLSFLPPSPAPPRSCDYRKRFFSPLSLSEFSSRVSLAPALLYIIRLSSHMAISRRRPDTRILIPSLLLLRLF